MCIVCFRFLVVSRRRCLEATRYVWLNKARTSTCNKRADAYIMLTYTCLAIIKGVAFLFVEGCLSLRCLFARRRAKTLPFVCVVLLISLCIVLMCFKLSLVCYRLL